MENVVAPERGRIAYEAYAEATGWKNYTGGPIPAWANLPEMQQYAWARAAQASQAALANKASSEQVQYMTDDMAGPANTEEDLHAPLDTH